MKGLDVSTRSIVFHDDGSVEIVYQEARDDQNGVCLTKMLQFRGDVDTARTYAFQQDCQSYIDDVLFLQREGPP